MGRKSIGRGKLALLLSITLTATSVVAAGLSPTPHTMVVSNGWPLSSGNFNGDGYSDLLIGGALYYGSPTGPIATGLQYGPNATSINDINGDGYSDIVTYERQNIIEYPLPTQDVQIYHGSASGPSTLADTEFLTTAVATCAPAGDVNGDSYADLIIGGCGMAYIYNGSPSGLSTEPAWTYVSSPPAFYFGGRVCCAGDVNGDGFADVLVAHPEYPNLSQGFGAVYAFYGSSSGLSSSPNWTMVGDHLDGHFGSMISTAGDLQNDGYADIIIGAPLQDNRRGAVYTFSGSSSGLKESGGSVGPPTFDSVQFGSSSAPVGDLDGDGLPECLISAPLYSNLEVNEGRIFSFPPRRAFAFETNVAYSYLGHISTAGDVNGDGAGDVMISASGLKTIYMFYGEVSAGITDWCTY